MAMRILICMVMSILPFCAATQGAPPAVHFSKTKWVVSGGYCPVGCPEAVSSFIKSQVGSEVTLSDGQLAAPFLDACEGSVHYRYQTMSADRLASELSQGQRKDKQFSRKNLQLENPKVLTAVAFCNSGGSDSTMARFLSIEPGRIRILFEEQSVIELH